MGGGLPPPAPPSYLEDGCNFCIHITRSPSLQEMVKDVFQVRSRQPLSSGDLLDEKY